MRNHRVLKAWLREKGKTQMIQMRGNRRTSFHALLRDRNGGLAVFMKDSEAEHARDVVGERIIKSKPSSETRTD